MIPWESRWWPALCKCAAEGGSNGGEIIEKVLKGHSMGWPTADGFLVLDNAEDGACVIWLGVGNAVRDWCGEAEREVSAFARESGCTKLRIEGRKGWRRVLPHWTVVGENLELSL